ncbi:radical SAM additional 4Fe4S-binding SPASM domain-containing protein [Thermomonospora echinospora]|uniref:Radical SAM additional 4Fe4S-binding SPASM domain-containing protein n=1 Tax=Thermomonospora echinospora TaxID=1992 RepID=A0A1H6DPH5_9ACTN|nr:radical SAM protein [Thermomonospora echinospora]SEG87212.1 radical SAM additional 4Fe4S-binding SPASM domain-containing protein [Thermomonospora echinospora]
MAADRAPLVLVPQFFGSLVFDRRTSRYLPFDADATALLRRLRDVPLERALAEAAGEEERGRVVRFFEHFYELGFFTVDGRFAGEVLDGVHVPPGHLAGPLAVHLEVVSACNLTCTHCFAGELPRRERRLTLDEIDRLFAEMAALGSFRLGLTGGEPLLRRDIFQIIDLALEHGLAPCITTNGLLITEEIAREFGRRELVWLNVSLEGASAATNDRVRGAGTFAKVLDRLAVLRRHARFTLAFTIMRTNVGEIEACARLAHEVGADTAVFRPLYPVGVARDHLELMPGFAEYNTALNTLARMDGGAMDLRHIDPFSPHSRQETQSVVHQNYGCGAGNLVCSISVSGGVNPCSFLGPEFVAANVRESSLAEIWHHSAGFQAIRALPHAEPSSERGHTATFAGGCRARALVLNGSVNAPDPWIEGQVEMERSSPQAVHNPLVVLDVTPRHRPACSGTCG